MEVIHTAPQSSHFTALSTYESTTPTTFHSPSRSVLHQHTPFLTLKILRSDLDASPTLSTLSIGSAATNLAANGGDGREEVSITGVDVWATSEVLILWRREKETGLRIRYECVILHALQKVGEEQEGRQGLYLQLQISPQSGGEDEEDTFVEFVLSQEVRGRRNNETTVEPCVGAEEREESEVDGDLGGGNTEIKRLFEAVSRCQELHPDPDPMDDEPMDESGGGVDRIGDVGDGGPYTVIGGQEGLPPPMPGSGGWITADNVGEWFDEEGQFRGGGSVAAIPGLGAGAGSVRTRDDDMNGDGDGVDGDGVTDGETKWRRTDS